jgi:hypothetical protein
VDAGRDRALPRRFDASARPTSRRRLGAARRARARARGAAAGLFLARVDGKSPVEYLTDEADRAACAASAAPLLADRRPRLAAVAAAWRAELDSS